MLGLLKKIMLYFGHLWRCFSTFCHNWKSGIISFVFSFVLVFLCLYILAHRSIVVKRIRVQLPMVISSLNELGIDLAYNEIKFNPMAFFPIVKIENPQLYSLNEDNYWSLQFNDVKGYSDIWGSPQIKFKFSPQGQLIIKDYLYDLAADKADFEIKAGQQQKLALRFADVNIKNLASIKKATFITTSLEVPNESVKGFPSYKSKLSIRDVKINGMVNYPLTSFIDRITAQSEIIGQFKYKDDFLTSIETWVKDGGFIDVPRLVVQWKPLTLVGRGHINIQENLQPEITFNTSSKGLLKLIKSLQDISWLTNSNVYVANILLSNKAFRLNPEDEELTITTPISYSNRRISIENLIIKDFDKDIRQ